MTEDQIRTLVREEIQAAFREIEEREQASSYAQEEETKRREGREAREMKSIRGRITDLEDGR